MPGGRPPHFDTPEALETAVNDYFEWVKGERGTIAGPDGKLHDVWNREPEPVTITGLCLYLGFESRNSLYDYAKRGQFSGIIKKAQLRVEHAYENKLSTFEKPTGPIFALKNMGWTDKQEISGPDGTPLIPPSIELPDGTKLEI